MDEQAMSHTRGSASPPAVTLPRLGHRPALDGLRGLAVAIVVLFHARWLPGGFFGVDLFFVLSGFLVTVLLLEERERTGTISLRSFYRRRVLRIVPALAVMLVVYLAIVTAIHLVLHKGDIGISLQTAAWSAIFANNWLMAARADIASELGPLWGVATEVQFYLIWPPILALLLHRGTRRRTLMVLLGVFVALGSFHRIRLGLEGVPWERTYYALDTRFDTIALGCLLGVWFTSGALALPRVRGALRIAVVPSLLLVVAGAIFVDGNHHAYLYAGGGFTLMAVAAAVLVAALVTDSLPPLARVFSSSFPVWLGAISYSLYLWHALFIGFVNFTVGPALGPAGTGFAIAMSVLVGWLSYRFVERPAVRRGRARPVGAQAARPAAGGMPE